jgi:hypothetical protein
MAMKEKSGQLPFTPISPILITSPSLPEALSPTGIGMTTFNQHLALPSFTPMALKLAMPINA